MIERSTKLDVRHRKSNVAFSELQKLNLYYQMERRYLLCARSQLECFIRHNPTCKTFAYDALRAIGATQDALANEYHRDHDALTKHQPDTCDDN